MSMPLGGNAKLAFEVESTYGTPETVGVSAGLRIFYDSFSADARKEPTDVEEISGISIDRSDFTEGAVIVGGTLNYRMRYYGGHAVLNGLALGDLDTSSAGGGAYYIHAATLADDLEAVTVFHQIPVMVLGVSTQRDNHFVGMKAARSTWSHRSGEILQHSIEFIGSYVDYLPASGPWTFPSTGGRTPTENFILWSHEMSSSPFTIKVEGASSTIQINVHSWEVTLDNGLARLFRIQNGRKSAEPPRDAFREVTARLEIEQDDAWEEFMYAYGNESTDASSDFDLEWTYQDPSASNHRLTFQLANCRTLDVPRGISGSRSVRQTVELRAHYQAGTPPLLNNPIAVTMLNTTAGPAAGSPSQYGDFL